MHDADDIAGNAALVMASSGGLGRASARALAERDANVVVNGRDEARLEATVADLREVGAGDVVGHTGDVAEAGVPAALVETTVDAFGGLDHLVTNAGGPPSGPFLETTDEDWYAAYDLLVMSAVRAVRAGADPLQAGDGGTIVAITSRSVKEAIDALVLSNAVRMAVIGLIKTLSTELAPAVRSNAVLPGPHETSRIESLIEQSVARGEYDSYEAGLAARGAANPMGRIGDPMELGRVVAFLCSPASSYVNGAALPVEGGQNESIL